MDAQQAAQEMQTLQRRLQSLDRNLAGLEQAMQELTGAIATLEGMTGDEALQAQIPIGGGVRVPASVASSQNVLVELGVGYSSEMPIPDALSQLRDRLTRTESAFQTTSQEADKTAERYQALQAQSMVPES